MYTVELQVKMLGESYNVSSGSTCSSSWLYNILDEEKELWRFTSSEITALWIPKQSQEASTSKFNIIITLWIDFKYTLNTCTNTIPGALIGLTYL